MTWAFVLLSPGRLWLSGVVIAVVGVCRRWPATWLCGGRSGLAVVILPCRFAASLPPPPVRCCVLQRSGLLLLGQNQYGERNNDGGKRLPARCRRQRAARGCRRARRCVGTSQMSHTQMLRRWKLWRCLLSPRSRTYVAQGRVEEHKRDGAPPVTGCRSEMETAAAWGHGAHDGGAGGVPREADPEENQMRAPSACRSCVRPKRRS